MRSDRSSLQPPLTSFLVSSSSAGFARATPPGEASEAAGPGRLGQSLHPAVELVSAPVEDDPLDAVRLGLLRDQLPDQLGRRRVSPVLEFLAEFRRPATNRDERLSSLVVDELGVDVLQAPEDGEARTRGRSPHALPDPEMPDLPSLDLDARQHGRLYFGVAAAAPAFLPTFRRMTSSAYFTPLPL